MKKFVLPFIGILISFYSAEAQEIIKPASPGYDELHEGISHGRIDTIVYNSTTVSTHRKALIYTPHHQF